MPRKPLFAVVALLALIEAGVLLTGFLGRHTPKPAAQSQSSSSITASHAITDRTSPAAPQTVNQTLYIEPSAGFSWLYTLVNNAHATIDMTMYELIDSTFAGDLVQACSRGVRVRVILDQSLEKSRNTPVYNQLNSAGPNCSAAWSNPQFQATHEKSLVIDGATAVILTLNLVSNDYASTRDMALVEDNPTDIGAMEATFNTDYNSTTDLAYQPGGGDDLIWSPTTATSDLLGLINGAKDTLILENEEMGAANVVSALEAACKRGVTTEIAMTDTSASYHSNYLALEAAGCGVHIGANNSNTLYIHAKAMVADLGTPAQTGYLGSINFSNASLTENRELGLFLHDSAILSQISSTLSADYAQFPAYQ